jgi:hypothetical protein
MGEATLGAESRMSKRVPVTSTTGCIFVMYFISYWKSLVHHYFISKIKKSHYIVKIASPFFLWQRPLLFFLDRIFFDFFTFNVRFDA